MSARQGNVLEYFLKDKSADTDLASDNTLNDDADLVYPMLANDDIHFEVWAFFTCDAGGIQVAMSGPAGFSHLHYSANLDISGSVKVTSNIGTAWDVTAVRTTSAQGMVRIVGHVHNGATPGDLVFRWAQNTSNVASTTIHQGSTIKVVRY